jgi:hypothetical protein
LIFLLLLGVYQINGDILVGNDAVPSTYLAAGLLEGRGMTFNPNDAPSMFVWTASTRQGPVQLQFKNWDQRPVDDPNAPTYRELRRLGALTSAQHRYYLVPSVRRDANGQPLYVNTFGPGAAATALPVFAVLKLFVEKLTGNVVAMWYGAKFTASALVAGSAAFIFLTACAYTGIGRSALIALAYGLGTCVWSISSQTLWQHGPNEFFLALGTLCLSRIFRPRTAEPAVCDGGRVEGVLGRWRWTIGCGLAYSAAVACRPTSLIVVAAVGAYLLIVNRRALLVYALACLPVAVALAAYNTYYLGAPQNFGQASAGAIVAMQKTGSGELWQTPLWLGAAGLLVSPSRGLLVFSPFVALAAVGIVQCWRRKEYAFLRPLVVALAALLVIAFKWFDWWGGWSFGYRPIVDAMPIFAVLLIPATDWVFRRRAVLIVVAVLVGWSVLVQVLGGWGYSMTIWNNRRVGYTATVEGKSSPVTVATLEELERLAQREKVTAASEVTLDIDQPAHRGRLWSITDSQIGYLLSHFGQSRERKQQEMDSCLHGSGG